MKETIVTTTKVDVPNDQEWETEAVPMIGDNIISLFDQLCYLVVFGNRSDMEAIITYSKERDDFFQGIRKSANKARDNFATSWKEQLRKEKTVSRRISRVRQSGRFDEDDEDGEGGEGGEENMGRGAEEEEEVEDGADKEEENEDGEEEEEEEGGADKEEVDEGGGNKEQA